MLPADWWQQTGGIRVLIGHLPQGDGLLKRIVFEIAAHVSQMRA